MQQLQASHGVGERVRLLRILDHQKKIALAAVKERTSESTTTVDEVEVGFKPSVSYKYRLNDLLRWATKNKVDLGGIILGKTEVEKIIKQQKKMKIDQLEEDVLADLVECRQETASNRFVY